MREFRYQGHGRGAGEDQRAELQVPVDRDSHRRTFCKIEPPDFPLPSSNIFMIIVNLNKLASTINGVVRYSPLHAVFQQLFENRAGT